MAQAKAIAQLRQILHSTVGKHNEFVKELKKSFEQLHEESFFTSFKPFIEMADASVWTLEKLIETHSAK